MRPEILFGAAILLAMAALGTAGAIGEPNPTAADQSLIKYLMRGKFSNDPQVAVVCFGYFIPLLNNITEEFSRSFQECADNETNRIGKLDDDAIGDRYQIELAADGVCVRLDACNDYSYALDYFDCISGQGSDNSRILYTVTQNSTEKGANLREQYRIAEVDKFKCQNASERVYVEDTATTYKQLDICLQTGEMPSTIPPNTTTPTTSITNQGQETTTPKNSSSSTSTDNPNSSPSTTEKQPEETTTQAPDNEPQQELPNGRGMKILSELRKFWRN